MVRGAAVALYASASAPLQREGTMLVQFSGHATSFGALAPAPAGDCPVLSLPDALVQPTVDPAQIQAEGTGQREAGQLLLAEDRWLLVVGDGGGTALIDLKAGTRIRDARDAIRVRFRAWRLVQKG